ncbi:MAG TPA: TolC family protein [Tepidisphaeraceae bacterium]|jgi:cobalt-zinc-cadmium efflux system outer membrane protein
MKRAVYRATWLIAFAALLNGCKVAHENGGFTVVQHVVSQRTGQTVEWNGHTASDTTIGAAIQKMLLHPLTADQVVQIALLNNQNLQAKLEELGIAKADLVQAGLLQNPVFAASWRFPDRAPHGTDAEYSVAENFLSLLILPLRKQIAEAEFQGIQLNVADEVFALDAEAKSAYFTFEAREQLLTRLRGIKELNQTAADLAARQHAAGTINDLDLINQQAICDEASIDFSHAREQLIADRERLNRLMGFADRPPAWNIAPRLPDIPSREMANTDLELLAMRQRLDLAAANSHIAALKKILSVTKGFRYFTTVDVGIDTEHGTNGQNVTGPTLSLEIPIFDQGQGRVAKIEAQFRQAQFRIKAMTTDIRSEVREVRDQMLAARDLTEKYRDLVPKRQRIVELTLQQYNGMLKGPYDLLLARQSQLAAEQGYIESWRDYWVDRTQLTRAVGGYLPDSSLQIIRSTATEFHSTTTHAGEQP